jgi:hypothetical protein
MTRHEVVVNTTVLHGTLEGDLNAAEVLRWLACGSGCTGVI